MSARKLPPRLKTDDQLHKLMLSTLILRKLLTVLPGTMNCFLKFGLLVAKGVFGNGLEVTSLQECSV